MNKCYSRSNVRYRKYINCRAGGGIEYALTATSRSSANEFVFMARMKRVSSVILE